MLSKYQINNDKYQELFYFCKQYNERKEEIASLYSLTAPNMDGMPKGNKTGSQTEAKAIRIERLKKENEMIEQAAIEASPYTYQYILKNVTEGIPYEYMKIPRGRRQFYEDRRLFFKILSEKR
jgi:hypothetical protein